MVAAYPRPMQAPAATHSQQQQQQSQQQSQLPQKALELQQGLQQYEHMCGAATSLLSGERLG